MANEKGFTVLEVVVAFGVFAVGVLGVLTMQLSAIAGNKRSLQQTVVAASASEVVEMLMLESYSSEMLLPGEHRLTRSGQSRLWYEVTELWSDKAPLKQIDVYIDTPKRTGKDPSGVRMQVFTMLKRKER